MSRRGPRILLIGGTYRALCVLERLLERGERVVAYIGQEENGERDFCSEILEMCDRTSIAARSGRKFGEEMVRWLEDRIRPELALAVGVTTEIPLAIGGNCRGGLVEVVEHSDRDGRPCVELRQRGQTVLEQPIEGVDELEDADEIFAASIEATLLALDHYLDRVALVASEPASVVPADPEVLPVEALERVASLSEPGRETDALEAEVARFLGAEHVVAVRSAVEAFAALGQAFGLGERDEFVCAPLSSGSALDGLRRCGARAVAAEVRADRLTLDPERLPDALSPRSRALLVSHAFGQPAQLAPLYALAAERGLEVIEDGGTALGARVEESRLGRSPCTCVFRLPLGGGVPGADVALVTLSARWAERALPALQALRVGAGAAGLARRRLAEIDDRIAARRERAAVYSAELSPYDAFVVPATPEDALPVYTQYVLRVTRYARTSAEDLCKLLGEAGIEARRVRVHCPERELVMLPVAESARSSALLLPISPRLDETQLERVLDGIFDYAIG